MLVILTYLYAFTNVETRDLYATLFAKCFKILGDVARQPVKWAYMYGSDDSVGRIRTVTVDMCRKQAPGMSVLFC